MHIQKAKINTVAYWLFFCCACVFCMIIVGAVTRLSGSGLSMVEWKPLMGALPPLHEKEWQRVFDLYKASPEYQKKNFWMDLSDFKTIFFWEWFHRVLGRLIGFIYAVPFVFFAARQWIPKGYAFPLFLIFLLGGAQGFMGWYMVKSGLVDIPAVSHYRLAAHLLLALLIYGAMFWTALDLRTKAQHALYKPDPALYGYGWAALCVLVLTVFWGAYTAGLDAGLVYNETFPYMGKYWIPEEVWRRRPSWISFFENHAGVQFVHRWLAIFTLVLIAGFSFYARRRGRTEKRFALAGIAVCVQLGLGIATLFSGVALPLAVMHQAGAVIVLTLLLSCIHAVK